MVGKFKKLLVDIAELPLEEQKEILTKAHLDWRGPVGQVDDIVIIGIRI